MNPGHYEVPSNPPPSMSKIFPEGADITLAELLGEVQGWTVADEQTASLEAVQGGEAAYFNSTSQVRIVRNTHSSAV